MEYPPISHPTTINISGPASRRIFFFWIFFSFLALVVHWKSTTTNKLEPSLTSTYSSEFNSNNNSERVKNLSVCLEPILTGPSMCLFITVVYLNYCEFSSNVNVVSYANSTFSYLNFILIYKRKIRIFITGKLVINTSILSSEEMERLFPHIQTGGHWQPNHCKQKQKLGIFIPMRDRWHQLPVLLRHLHQLLVSEWRHYTIYVIEQTGNVKCHSIL